MTLSDPLQGSQRSKAHSLAEGAGQARPDLGDAVGVAA